MFTHLHVHSYYSFLEGLASPRALVDTAVQYGMNALALTDHARLTGVVEFYDACRTVGVRPILGLELDVLPSNGLSVTSPTTGRLVLLAMDLKGWGSLCRLSSAAQSDPDHPGPIPLSLDELSTHNAGLLCMTGGPHGLASRLVAERQERAALDWLGRLAELFPDRLYIELQMPTSASSHLSARLARVASRLKLPLAAAHSISYLSPEDAPLQRVVSAIRLNCTLEHLPEDAAALPGAYFVPPNEMEARFANNPHALDGTREITERCRLELPLGQSSFPAVDLPSGETAEGVLRQRAFDGARRLYGETEGQLAPQVNARLEHELGVIAECGYTALFLIMQEIIEHARQIGVPTASRGSASSSLVAHCLGITSPDPLGLNLYFERFLNAARATPPDIDTDLCSRRRDEVIDFVYHRFGSNRVAMVGTINRYRRRSALRDVAKVYGLPKNEISQMADSLPRWWGPPECYSEGEDPFVDLGERFHTDRHRQVMQDAAALLGMPRHLSVHPGGIVIAPGELHDLAPTLAAPKGVTITQFDLDSIERLGLVKIDLLGIRGLSVLGQVAESISARQKNHSMKRSSTSVSHPSTGSVLDVLDAIPTRDPATSDRLERGGTIGCFQIESPGMRATLREIHARSIDDLMAALALYRPGPLTGGLKDAFVRRYRGLEPVSHIHPALEPLLDDTYGVIIYQEQVLRIASSLAGLSLAEADLLRRAMSHFDPGKEMQTLRERFVSGVQNAGVPEAVGRRIWEMMAAFAGYGFPKAHAASYAMVAWRAAWCKTHHPAEFMAAVLANWGGYYGQRVYVMEARRMGLTIRPPLVNYAQRDFSLVELDGQPVLVMGLDQVRDLTRGTQKRILKERPFHSWEDFIGRADPRPVEAVNLVRCGALDGLGTIPGLLRRLKSGSRQSQTPGQLSLFSQQERYPEDEQDWTIHERVAAQETILGVEIDAHPLELVAGQITAAGALTTLEAAEQMGRVVRIAGMRQTWRRSANRRGGSVYFMSLEDLDGMFDVIIPGEVYRRYQKVFYDRGPYILEGMVEINPQRGELVMQATRVERI